MKAHKDKAGAQSADLMRSQREIGALRKQLEQVPVLVAEVARLQADNDELQGRVRGLERELAAAAAEQAAAAAKVAVFDQLEQAFRTLGNNGGGE